MGTFLFIYACFEMESVDWCIWREGFEIWSVVIGRNIKQVFPKSEHFRVSL